MSNFGDRISDVAPGAIHFSDKADKEGFINPRHFYQGGEAGAMNGIGFDDESMRQLSMDIQERGITTPLICRWVTPDGKPCGRTATAMLQLVDGERRLRSAIALVLETVPCLIHENMSDDDAWMNAWRSNDTPKSIGENATAALVKHWRQCGYNDQQIVKITNRTAQWLRQMDALGNLDEKSFDAYTKGLLSLRVALKLAIIDDLALRHGLLDETLADAERDHQDLIARYRKAVEKAEEKVEDSKAIIGLAEITGDKVDQEEVDQVKNLLKGAEKALAEASANQPQAKAKNLTRASKKVGADAVASALTKAKMQKCLSRVENWIEHEGRDGNDFIGQVDHLHLAKCVLSACLNGNDNMKKVFADFYKIENQLGLDEDEDEYEEDEYEEEVVEDIDDIEEDPEEIVAEEEGYDELRKYAGDD